MTEPIPKPEPSENTKGISKVALNLLEKFSQSIGAPLEIVPHDSQEINTTPIRAGSRLIGHLKIQIDNKPTKTHPDLTTIAKAIGSISDLENRLQHRIAELDAVYKVSADLAGLDDLDILLHSALETVIGVMGMDAGAIRLFDEDSGQLVVKAWVNLSDKYFNKGPILIGDSELDRRALNGEMVYTRDLSKDARVLYPDLVRSEGIRSFLCAGLVFRNKPVGVMRLYTRHVRDFDKYERRLFQAAAQQVATAIENRTLVDQHREAQQMHDQIQLAANVQKRMLPQESPNIPGIDIDAHCLPSLELGGDFFDFIDLKGNLGLAIGDVVGKGIPAALHTASVRATLRAHALDVFHINQVLELTNRAMSHDSMYHEFATLWYGVIHPTLQRLTYCNAGHEPTLVCRRTGDINKQEPNLKPVEKSIEQGPFTFYELSGGGMVLGIDPSQTYDKGIFHLQHGDTLIAYSDGLSEALNFDQELFGRYRIRQAIVDIFDKHNGSPTATEILNHILWEARRFVGFNEQSDDITIIVARMQFE